MKCQLKIFVLFVLLGWSHTSFTQDTFSIVAIDTTNGQVGSAAASFVGGCTRELASSVFYVYPGVGAIHTQAYYDPNNALNAWQWMADGKAPQAIIDSVVANDVADSPSVRQYIVIDLENGGRTAGYTGSDCPDYKNHVLGKDYAIAGNIFYGQQVLDSMESGFVNTSGTLADRLMAALMGGKTAGGDMRGADYHLSSLMAALKVANPEDREDSLYIDLLVAYDPVDPGVGVPTVDPVDSLQSIYNEWKIQHPDTSQNDVYDFQKQELNYCLNQNYPNPFNPSTTISYSLAQRAYVSMKIHDMLGREIRTLIAGDQAAGSHRTEWDGFDERGNRVPSGIYFYTLTAKGFRETRKLVMLR
jgi:uncharacterized Ntn-hydrolase superfamily protein